MTCGTKRSWREDVAHPQRIDGFLEPAGQPDDLPCDRVLMPPSRRGRGRTAGRSSARASSRSGDDGGGGDGDGDADSTLPAETRGDPSPLMTVPEAAALLRTTPKGIYAMVERGFLRGAVRRFGKRILLKREALLSSTRFGLEPSSGRS